MLHILVGENDALEAWADHVRGRRPINWIVLKSAAPGDDVLFVFNRDQFVGSGVIASDPVPGKFNGQSAYRADVRELKQFKRNLSVEDVAHRLSDWKWLASLTKGRTTPAEPIARKLHRLVQAHVARVGLTSDAPPPAAESQTSRRRRGAATEAPRYRRANENPVAGERDPFEVDPEKIERGNRGHAVTQNALLDFLRVHGFQPWSHQTGEPEFDLAWRADDTTYVAEVKSLTNSNEEKQLRLGLGQVLRYRHLMSRRGTRTRTIAVLVAERKPTDATWIATCEALEVVLVWPAVFDRLR